MKTMQWSILFVITLVGVCNMSGCWIISLLDRPDPMITDAQGRRVFADTPRNWAEWREAIDSDIENEIKGRRSPALTWKEDWILNIQWIDKVQENAPRYINHIIQSRRNGGLPELYMITNAQDIRILADNPQNWSYWRSAVDALIEDEKMEKPAPGFPTWNVKWLVQIRNLGKIQENSQRYIDYLIETRRNAGLPELDRSVQLPTYT